MRLIALVFLLALPVYALAEGQANVTLTPPTEDVEGNPLTGERALTKFQLFFGIEPVTEANLGAPLEIPATETSWSLTLSGGDAGLTYYFRAKACIGDVCSDLSGEATKFIEKDQTIIYPPKPPVLSGGQEPIPDVTVMRTFDSPAIDVDLGNFRTVVPFTTDFVGVEVEYCPPAGGGVVFSGYPLRVSSTSEGELVAEWTRSSDAYSLSGPAMGGCASLAFETRGWPSPEWRLAVGGEVVFGQHSKGMGLSSIPWGQLRFGEGVSRAVFYQWDG